MQCDNETCWQAVVREKIYSLVFGRGTKWPLPIESGGKKISWLRPRLVIYLSSRDKKEPPSHRRRKKHSGTKWSLKREKTGFPHITVLSLHAHVYVGEDSYCGRERKKNRLIFDPKVPLDPPMRLRIRGSIHMLNWNIVWREDSGKPRQGGRERERERERE